MEEVSINDFVKLLTEKSKVLLLGGMAIIAHGLTRGTRDVDLWMEPKGSAEEWLEEIRHAISQYSESLTIHGLPGWQELTGDALIKNIEDVGMVRILGLTVPLDIFRKPNGYEHEQFDSVWKNSILYEAGVRLPRAADLLPTKENTGRERDSADWYFLLTKSRREQGDALAKASTAEEATTLLNDYFDYDVCRRGLTNQNEEVRNVILAELQRLADDGDPFAKEILSS